jgi:hypothetical protein
MWMVINSGFEEGGYKQSGIGRLGGARGLAVFHQDLRPPRATRDVTDTDAQTPSVPGCSDSNQD